MKNTEKKKKKEKNEYGEKGKRRKKADKTFQIIFMILYDNCDIWTSK